MANTTGKGLKVSIKTKDGENVEVTHHLRAVTFGKQTTRRRTGILGWLAWTFNIQSLKWIVENEVGHDDNILKAIIKDATITFKPHSSPSRIWSEDTIGGDPVKIEKPPTAKS